MGVINFCRVFTKKLNFDIITMNTIYIDDPKLIEWVKQKEILVNEGSKLTDEIDVLDREMKKIDLKIQKAESKIDVNDLQEKGKEIGKQLAELMKQAEAVKKDIYARIKSGIPADLIESYKAKEKQKENTERERAKIGHKIQKVKDRIIPRAQQLGKEHLPTPFDDFETLTLTKDGKIEMKLFNHKELWEEKFLKNRK